MKSNKKLIPKVNEFFLRGRKLNVFLVFISQSYFKVPKTILINETRYSIIKLPNNREHIQKYDNEKFHIRIFITKN